MALITQNLDEDNDVTVEIRDASPSHFLLKIENFSNLSEIGADKYESTEFSAGDHKWRLVLYPNGEDSGNDGDKVAVYLAVADTKSLPTRWEVNAVFSIFLYNHKSDNFISMRGRTRRFHAVNPQWGFPKFISKKSLIDPCNGYLLNNNCVFGAEVFVIKSQGVIESLSMLKAGKTYEHCWRISQFSKLENVWVSEEFHVGYHYWKLEMHPRGYNGKDRSISVFLFSVDSNLSQFLKVKAKCTLKVKDQCNGNHSIRSFTRWFTYSGEFWGWPTFMSISDMNDPVKGFLVEDCCSLEVEILVQAVARSVLN